MILMGFPCNGDAAEPKKKPHEILKAKKLYSVTKELGGLSVDSQFETGPHLSGR